MPDKGLTMPIYEYRCTQCRRKSSHLFRSYSDTHQAVCTHCGSPDLVRLMSTFAIHKPFDSKRSFPSSETLGDFDEDDPRSTAEWVKGMRRDMGGAFGGEYDDLIERMEAGDVGNEDDSTDALDF